MLKFLRKTLLWMVLIPYAFTWGGTLSNQAVLWANNDTFPVRINLVKLMEWSDGGKGIKVIPPDFDPAHPDGAVMLDNIHCLMTNKTHLNWLADNFDFHQSIESIGDLLIDLGQFSGQYMPILWFGFAVARLRRMKEEQEV